MRTLNRPMFRYGGPIKEGVMNGIREPKRNGGSMMGNNEGPRRAALVGNPIYPQGSDGRTNHALPAILGAPYIGAALRFAAPAFGKFVQRTVPKLYKEGTKRAGKQIGKQTTKVEGFDPNAVGRFFANDPLAGKAMTGAGFTGKALQKGFGAAKYATTTPSGLLFLGAPVTYMAGKYFLGDGTELKGGDLNKIKKVGVNTPSGNNPFGYEDDVKTTPGGEKQLTPAEREKIEADNRMKQMDRYKEIMNIKGMSRDAAYKSLIDASNIIREGGNLKEGIKDGSLISKLTTAASKRFDKVSDTETALRSLIAKGEIEKEMNKEKNALDNKKTNLQIKAAEKTLAGASLAETANAVYEKTGKFPKGNDLANVARTKGIEVVGIEDSTAVENWIGENGGDEITYMQDIIARGIDVAPGPHVLRSRIILVDSEGNVSPYF